MTPEDLADRLERRLAFYFSHNNQPCMSGDPRDRCSPLQRRNLSEAVASVIEEMQVLSALAPQAGDKEEEPEAWIIRCKGWGEELRFTEDGAKELADRLEKICGKTASITPLYSHPCASTPVVSQNAPDLEDKGGDE